MRLSGVHDGNIQCIEVSIVKYNLQLNLVIANGKDICHVHIQWIMLFSPYHFFFFLSVIVSMSSDLKPSEQFVYCQMKNTSFIGYFRLLLYKVQFSSQVQTVSTPLPLIVLLLHSSPTHILLNSEPQLFNNQSDHSKFDLSLSTPHHNGV